MRILLHQRPYGASKDHEELLSMVVKAMTSIYAIQGPFDLKRTMREKVFHDLVWMVTEHDGKYTTRYRSKAALIAECDVQHEHIFPINDLFFLSRHGSSLKDVFTYCAACVVTVEEHSLLSS
jgi:hypothetical protein